MTRPLRISLGVTTTDDAQTTRAIEVLGRALAGLALENIEGSLLCYPDEETT